MAAAPPNGPEQPAGAGPVGTRPGYFNRERFLFTLLAAVILTELLVYLTGTAVCSYRSLHGLVQDGACLTDMEPTGEEVVAGGDGDDAAFLQGFFERLGIVDLIVGLRPEIDDGSLGRRRLGQLAPEVITRLRVGAEIRREGRDQQRGGEEGDHAWAWAASKAQAAAPTTPTFPPSAAGTIAQTAPRRGKA